MRNSGMFRKSLVYGVGVDDMSYPKERREYSHGKSKVVWYCKVFSRWKNMLRRCYSGSDSAYSDVTVCNEWLTYSNYYKWLIENAHESEGEWDVDKDIVLGSSRIYSPETCVVVPRRLNLALVVANKGLPGTYYEKSRNRWQAYCEQFHGGRRLLGRYASEKAAHRMWQIEKLSQLNAALKWYCAEFDSNQSVVLGFSKIIDKLSDDIDNDRVTTELRT